MRHWLPCFLLSSPALALDAWAARVGGSGCGFVAWVPAPATNASVRLTQPGAQSSTTVPASASHAQLQLNESAEESVLLEVRRREVDGVVSRLAIVAADLLAAPPPPSVVASCTAVRHETLQAAVDAAGAAAVVVAAPGTWRGEGNCGVRLGRVHATTLLALGGEAATTIDCEGRTQTTAVHFAADAVGHSSLVGFTLSGATASAVVIADGAAAALRQCVVRDSSGAQGGGVLATGGTVELVDCTLEGNHATQGGGGVALLSVIDARLLNVTFRNNTAMDVNYAGHGGGGLYILGGSVLVNLSHFENNQALGSGGGGGVMATQADLQLVDTHVSSNACASAGGGLSFYSDLSHPGRLMATNLTVSNNTAAEGGGVDVYTSVWSQPLPAHELVDVWVHSNRATLASGGGIRLFGRVTARLTGVAVTDNSAAAGGGGLLAEPLRTNSGVGSPQMELRGVSVARNSAAAGGGAFFLMASLVAEGCTWAHNVAGSGDLSTCAEVFEGGGGSLYMKNSALVLNQSSIEYSRALHYGGAMLVQHSPSETSDGLTRLGLSASARVWQSALHNNRASRGGAIASVGGEVHLSHSELTRNGDGDTVAGGALFCSGGAAVSLSHSLASGNTAIRGGAFGVGDSQIDGSGRGCKVHAMDVVCDSNVAERDGVHSHGGGCAHVALGAALAFLRANVSANRADGVGGAALAAGELTVSDGTLEHNQAPRGGGVALTTGGECNVTRSALTANAAAEAGGAVYLLGGTMLITHSTVARNEARGGGAVAVDGGAVDTAILSILHSNLTSNTAAYGAIGAIGAQRTGQFGGPSFGGSILCGSGGAANLCAANRATGWGDSFATLPAAVVYVPPSGRERRGPLDVDASVTPGDAISGELQLTDVHGELAPSPSSVYLSFVDASAASDEATGCTRTYCLDGERILPLPPGEAVLNLSSVHFSAAALAPPQGNVTLLARAVGAGWSLTINLTVAISACAPGFGGVPSGSQWSCAACAAGYSKEGVGMQHCTPCRAGTFSAAAAAPSCEPCAPGTSTNLQQRQVRCTPCAAGTSTDDLPAQPQCTPCALGSSSSVSGSQAAPADGLAACVPCSPGYHAPGAGMAVCEPCQSAVPSFSVRGQPHCALCADGADCAAVSSAAVNASDWWFCRLGLGDCTQLALGAEAHDGAANRTEGFAGGFAFKGAARGYWAALGALRPESMCDGGVRCVTSEGEPGVLVLEGGTSVCVACAPTQAQRSSTPFYPCIRLGGLSAGRCLGAAQRNGFESECAEGHGGPICGHCLPGYYTAYGWGGTTCARCEESDQGMTSWLASRQTQGHPITSHWMLTLAVAFGAGALVLMGVLLPACLSAAAGRGEAATARNRRLSGEAAVGCLTQSIFSDANLWELLPTTSEAIKQMFAHLQIVSILPSVLAVSWPPALVQMAAAFRGVFSLDIDALLRLQCVAPESYYEKMLRNMIVTLTALAAVPGTYVLVRCMANRRFLLSLDALALQRLGERCCSTYVVLFFLLYTPASTSIVRFFKCVEFGAERYLLADVANVCYHSDGSMDANYAAWLPVAVSGLFLIVVGLPMTNLAILMHLRRGGKLEDASSKRAFGMLYVQYSRRNFFWDIVETTKKLCFTSALVIFTDNLRIQCALGMLMLLALLVALSNRQPHLRGADTWLATAAHLGVLFLILFALQLESGYYPPAFLIISLALAPFALLGGTLCFVAARAVLGKLCSNDDHLTASMKQHLHQSTPSEAAFPRGDREDDRAGFTSSDYGMSPSPRTEMNFPLPVHGERNAKSSLCSSSVASIRSTLPSEVAGTNAL
ncbi:hypothetical protein AB1Y20_019990 [Prymnesium parvum]|uniref:Right handed beta helix domain-containing protein n=1 Tax=Prymnesium parvum TaxID=97485 RepID=A0AB34JVR3_PRYPA